MFETIKTYYCFSNRRNQDSYILNHGLTLPLVDKAKKRPLEDSWTVAAGKKKRGNNKFNYRMSQKVDCNFNQVQNRKNTWMYNTKFLEEQVCADVSDKIIYNSYSHWL